MKKWAMLFILLLFFTTFLVADDMYDGDTGKIYVAMAFSRLHNQPSAYSLTVGMANFGVGLAVVGKQYDWYKVQVIPEQADSIAYIHQTSVLEYDAMEELLGEDPEAFVAKMEDSAVAEGTSNFSERTGVSYATKGFSERTGVSYATKGFSEMEETSMTEDGYRYDLVDLIDDSTNLTISNPTEQLRRFRAKGMLGEYKW